MADDEERGEVTSEAPFPRLYLRAVSYSGSNVLLLTHKWRSSRMSGSGQEHKYYSKRSNYSLYKHVSKLHHLLEIWKNSERPPASPKRCRVLSNVIQVKLLVHL